jgi:hypothetical protein
MPDKVWPLSHQPRLHNVNGHGTELKSFTRADSSGRYFATGWATVAGMPLIPLRRYYLSQGGTTFEGSVVRRTVKTHYQIAGESRLRASEVLRTYVFCWLLAPAVILGPVIAFFTQVDAIADALSGVFILVIAAPFAWIFGIGYLVTKLLDVYRARWAPVREVEWIEEPFREDWREAMTHRDGKA